MPDPRPGPDDPTSPRPASDTVLLRTATAADLPAIAGIYNDAVLTSVATFDVDPQPAELFADRVSSTRSGDHVVVAESDGRVVGMAYAATYRPRPAYDGTRETSVYLAADARGRGLGLALYTELLRRVDADGIHVCLAVIAEPNAASEALHAAIGFERRMELIVHALRNAIAFRNDYWRAVPVSNSIPLPSCDSRARECAEGSTKRGVGSSINGN